LNKRKGAGLYGALFDEIAVKPPNTARTLHLLIFSPKSEIQNNFLNQKIVEYLPVLLAMCFSRSITSPFLLLGKPLGQRGLLSSVRGFDYNPHVQTDDDYPPINRRISDERGTSLSRMN
jgi:hypothetical protein